MPFSYTEIEQAKKWNIYLLFLILIFLYFFTAWSIGNIIKFFLWIRRPYSLYPYLGLKEVIVVLGISLLAGIIHWIYSIKNGASKLLTALNAQPLDIKDAYHQRLRNIVSEIMVATGSQKAIECVVIPSVSMNAFALMDFKRKPIIGVTEGLLSKLKRHQLEAIVAHEMAHIISGDCLMTTISTALFDVYNEMLKGVSSKVETAFDKNSYFKSISRNLGSIIFIHIFLSLLQMVSLMTRMAISRQREYQVDAIAVRLTRNPLALAEALYAVSRGWRGAGSNGESFSPIFIMNPISSPLDEQEDFWSNLFATHPPVKKRLKILLDMASMDLQTLVQNMETKEKKKIKRETIIPLTTTQLPERWFVINEKNGEWLGPFSLLELSSLKWFRPETWVKQEGGEKVTLAYENKRLLEMFRGNLKKDHILELLCPHCQVELLEVLYESAPIWMCQYCQGVLVKEAKLSAIIVREDQDFREEIKRLGSLSKFNKGITKLQIDPKFSLSCPKCRNKMDHRFYSAAYLVEIDSCSQCSHIWFDKNELEVLQYLIEEANSGLF